MTKRKITIEQVRDLIATCKNIYLHDKMLAKMFEGKVRRARTTRLKLGKEVIECQATAIDSVGHVVTIGMDGIWRQH